MGSLASNIDTTSSVFVTCTNNLPYDIGLNEGTTAGGTTTTRLMDNAGTTVSYQMFSNAGRTTNWGDAVGIDTVAGTGTGSSQALTVYGRVPTQSTPTPGTYTDTVVVTVTF